MKPLTGEALLPSPVDRIHNFFTYKQVVSYTIVHGDCMKNDSYMYTCTAMEDSTANTDAEDQYNTLHVLAHSYS